ncbi:MAG: hypothetical protein JJ916_06630 [Phycisphaerales bacterium]|nr:hypothetical protein [Phycisphaerales bacterium]
MAKCMEWICRPSWACVAALCVLLNPTSSVQVANASDQTNDNGSDSGNDQDPGTRYEQWMFVSVPLYGIASMQEVLEEGSPANLAFLSVGEPIESYEPVPMLGTTQTVHNGAVVIHMLPQRCLGDYNDDGVVNLYDAPYFIDAYVSMDMSADLSRDGAIDVRDQMTFMLLNTMPCASAWGL